LGLALHQFKKNAVKREHKNLAGVAATIKVLHKSPRSEKSHLSFLLSAKL
jgi:hypothetical protein